MMWNEIFDEALSLARKPIGTRILQHYIDEAKAEQRKNMLPFASKAVEWGSAGMEILNRNIIPNVIGCKLHFHRKFRDDINDN